MTKNNFGNLRLKAENLQKKIKSLVQFIQTVKGREQLLVTGCFLTCSWRFLKHDKLEHSIRIQIGKKILGFRNMQEKLEK